MDANKRQSVMKAFIGSYFNYCPRVCMSHYRGLNNKISRIYERSLRIGYDDNKSSFEGLLQKVKLVKIHHKNLKVFATETCKARHGLLPQKTNNIFELKNVSYNMRRNGLLRSQNIHFMLHGTENLTYLGPKTLDIAPRIIKNSESVSVY